MTSKSEMWFCASSSRVARCRDSAKCTALAKEKLGKAPVLFPLRLDNALMDTTQQWAHDIRDGRHIGDFRKWKDHDSYQKAFERLLRDLRAETTPST